MYIFSFNYSSFNSFLEMRYEDTLISIKLENKRLKEEVNRLKMRVTDLETAMSGSKREFTNHLFFNY